MLLSVPFNAHNVDPSQNIGFLPVGKHLVIIESSEVKATKANERGQQNGYLRLILQVVDGPAKGTSGQYNLNIYHSGTENSAKTVEIANQKLSAICHATGVFLVTDTNQLHNIPFYVEVVSQNLPDKPNYTEVKRVFDAHGNEPVRGQGPRAPAQPTQPSQPQAPAQQPAQPPQAAWQQPPQAAQAPAQASGWTQPGQPSQAPQAAWQQPPQAPQAPAQAPANGQPGQAPSAPPWGASR